MVSNVPPGQVGLKASAPDSPLSSVLGMLSETQRKTDTAYRRGEDLRREVGELARRLDKLQLAEPSTDANPELAHTVRELSKWKAQAAQRMAAIIDFVNDAVAATRRVEEQVEGTTKSLTACYLRQAEETSQLKAAVAALNNRVKLSEAFRG